MLGLLMLYPVLYQKLNLAENVIGWMLKPNGYSPNFGESYILMLYPVLYHDYDKDDNTFH